MLALEEQFFLHLIWIHEGKHEQKIPGAIRKCIEYPVMYSRRRSTITPCTVASSANGVVFGPNALKIIFWSAA